MLVYQRVNSRGIELDPKLEVPTIFQAIFSGDIPLHMRPFRILKFPLIIIRSADVLELLEDQLNEAPL